MTRVLMVTAVLLLNAVAPPAAGQPSRAPVRLAIYHGYPSLVEHAHGDVRCAAAVFGAYDAVVFGDGLELDPAAAKDPGLRAERERMGPLIARLRATGRRPRVYGYIDLGSSQSLSLAEITQRIERWRRVGADGIFLDEAGRDFQVTTERLQAAVAAVHGQGLSAFLNAFDPDDLFVGMDGLSSRAAGRLGPRDALLLESFAIRNGEPEPVERIAARAAAARKWRDRHRIQIFGITTTDGRSFAADHFRFAWSRAVAEELDGMGWGERHFSADSRLPGREKHKGHKGHKGQGTLAREHCALPIADC